MSAYQVPKQALGTRTLTESPQRFTVNDIIKLTVVVTMCLSLLGVIYMAIAGLVEAMVVVTFVLTTLTGIIAGAGIGYVNNRNTETARQDAFALGKQSQQNEYQAAMLNIKPK